MNRQMSAERVRRAVIIEAEGTRQSAITVAEGEKQAAILKAEGHKESEILTAEGDKQAAVLRAEGYSVSLDKIQNIAKDITSNTMSLQYFDTLKSIGEGQSTKYIFPMEFTNLLKPFIESIEDQIMRTVDLNYYRRYDYATLTVGNPFISYLSRRSPASFLSNFFNFNSTLLSE